MTTAIDEMLKKKRAEIKEMFVPEIVKQVLYQQCNFTEFNEFSDEEIDQMVADKHEAVCASTSNVSIAMMGTTCCIGLGCTGGSYCA